MLASRSSKLATHVNDPAFAEAMAERLDVLVGASSNTSEG